MSNVIDFPGRQREGIPICPRCGSAIPSNEKPGEYPGALSRVDNLTQICSQCGTEEAMEDVFGRGPTPFEDWPLQRDRLWHGLG